MQCAWARRCAAWRARPTTRKRGRGPFARSARRCGLATKLSARQARSVTLQACLAPANAGVSWCPLPIAPPETDCRATYAGRLHRLYAAWRHRTYEGGYTAHVKPLTLPSAGALVMLEAHYSGGEVVAKV